LSLRCRVRLNSCLGSACKAPGIDGEGRLRQGRVSLRPPLAHSLILSPTSTGWASAVRREITDRPAIPLFIPARIRTELCLSRASTSTMVLKAPTSTPRSSTSWSATRPASADTLPQCLDVQAMHDFRSGRHSLVRPDRINYKFLRPPSFHLMDTPAENLR